MSEKPPTDKHRDEVDLSGIENRAADDEHSTPIVTPASDVLKSTIPPSSVLLPLVADEIDVTESAVEDGHHTLTVKMTPGVGKNQSVTSSVLSPLAAEYRPKRQIRLPQRYQ
jgi:hypothetical protein